MDILFVIDRLELKYFEFNNLVTNFWIIRELLNENKNVFITTIDKLGMSKGIPFAHCYESYEKDGNIFYEKTDICKDINDFQLVMFRPDPPVDLDYINATYIFDFVDRNKTLILNDPKAIRDFNEKMHTCKFLDLMPENIVTCSKSDIIEFLNRNEEIVLKPLNACFGAGVMTLKKGDKNTAVIINMMTKNQSQLIMVQKYIPKAKFGDKRVMFLGEEVLDVCVQKLPSNDDFKFNEHCDSNIIKAELTQSEKEKFLPVAKELTKLGLPLVGLDVIDEKIIEINVTSPCYFIKEVNGHFGCNLEKKITDFILSQLYAKVC
ncbi:glutathione synthetase [Clostridium sp. CAG:715]|nr:glutathione synthetase [Clostridium sp. CAG:715]